MEIEVSEKEKRRSDPYIWGIIIILYIVSVVEVYSAISREITGGDVYSPIIKHIMLLFSGFVITYVTSQIHYKWFKVLAYLMIPLTIVLLVSILFWGKKRSQQGRDKAKLSQEMHPFGPMRPCLSQKVIRNMKTAPGQAQENSGVEPAQCC